MVAYDGNSVVANPAFVEAVATGTFVETAYAIHTVSTVGEIENVFSRVLHRWKKYAHRGFTMRCFTTQHVEIITKVSVMLDDKDLEPLNSNRAYEEYKKRGKIELNQIARHLLSEFAKRFC